MSDRILVTYRLRGEEKEIHSLARKIAIEQSVETPESVISPEIERRCVGRIESINAVLDKTGSYDVLLSYSPEMLSQQLNQLLIYVLVMFLCTKMCVY